MRKYTDHIEMASRRPKGGAHAAGWTPDRIDLLRRYWLEGLSSAQIAKRLGGVTRNAVLGKRIRLGLTRRVAPGNAIPRPKGASKPKPKPKPKLKIAQEPPKATQPPALAAPPPIPDAQACKWITGDPRGYHTWCAAPTEPNSSWCAEHKRLAYAPTRAGQNG